MSNRTICGGGKGGGSAYDPQIGRAAAQTASTAQEALDWSKQYYADVITPMLQQQTEASIKAQGQMGNLYDLQAEQMKLGAERYKEYGIPAENKYYQMAQQYSEPAEYERQAALAKGDLETAQANEMAQATRQMGGLGINPASPAFASAMADASVRNAAAQASAMNRARQGAKQLGMALTADAANFASGKGASNIAMFGQGALGASSGAFGVANQTLNTGMQAGSGVQAGYGQALQGYGSVMDMYGGMGRADIAAQAASSPFAGLGSLAGSLLGSGGVKGLFSDRRLKVNVIKVGELKSGLSVYEYDYVWGGPRQRGVMAQEVRHVIPDAVICDKSGYLAVDYSKVF